MAISSRLVVAVLVAVAGGAGGGSASAGAVLPVGGQQKFIDRGLLDSAGEQARSWYDNARQAYKKRVVTPLRVPPEQGLLGAGQQAATPAPARVSPAAPPGPSSPGQVGQSSRPIGEQGGALWDSVVSHGAEAGQFVTRWLEVSNRNYQSILVRQLKVPEPQIAWKGQFLTPGSRALFGYEDDPSLVARVERSMPKPAVAPVAPVPAPKVIATKPDEKAIASAPRAKPIELPEASVKGNETASRSAAGEELDRVKRARAAETAEAERKRVEERATAALALAEKRLAAEREAERKAAAEREQRLASLRAAEEKARALRAKQLAAEQEQQRQAVLQLKEKQTANERRERVQRLADQRRTDALAKRAEAKKRRAAFVIASHSRLLQTASVRRAPPDPVPKPKGLAPPPAPVIALPLPVRNISKPRSVRLSAASRRRLAGTTRSNLGVAPIVRPGNNGSQRQRRVTARGSCGGNAGRRIGGRYVVASGDSLWRIAQRYSRNPQAYVAALRRVNRGRISNANVIRTCQQLRLP